ncbi:hypothetical protein KVR01_010621 [Diaporthe batatas]|uniref:uncharacterized protein n=1 Tax=Diaporthe batatas TaxID=748121 RepID=UPI001D04E10C|nr:uncharacterized protein KVR01_010621 [Diaporthe batatas]KAG8159984.1 hypothetical protein KVR01_010621 [Diaporthe batatas]
MASVTGALGFSDPLPDVRFKYHANNTSLDVMNITQRKQTISDARALDPPPSLDVEGFTLVSHKSVVQTFRDQDEIRRVHVPEIRDLLLGLTGADEVEVRGAGVLRFGERSSDSGALNNSRPARFVHVDISDSTAAAWNAGLPVPEGRRLRRAAHLNVWRVLTPPPQDVPLAVCDARSLAPGDLHLADAMFDDPDGSGRILHSFEGLVVRQGAGQRWWYYSDMRTDEVLVFKTNDTEEGVAHAVAHGISFGVHIQRFGVKYDA